MKAPIDWNAMPLEEHTRELEAGRASAARKVARLLAAAGLTPQKGRGRPSSDPLAGFLLPDGEDQETDQDDANGAAS